MKKYVGNGYYYVNSFKMLCLNSSNPSKKMCLNSGKIIKDKETLKILFANELRKDFQNNKICSFVCTSHYSFIDLIKSSGYKVIFETKLPKKVNAKNLFKSWECSDCSCCEHHKECYVCIGDLPNFERQIYIVLFSRKKEM